MEATVVVIVMNHGETDMKPMMVVVVAGLGEEEIRHRINGGGCCKVL